MPNKTARASRFSDIRDSASPALMAGARTVRRGSQAAWRYLRPRLRRREWQIGLAMGFVVLVFAANLARGAGGNLRSGQRALTEDEAEMEMELAMDGGDNAEVAAEGDADGSAASGGGAQAGGGGGAGGDGGGAPAVELDGTELEVNKLYSAWKFSELGKPFLKAKTRGKHAYVYVGCPDMKGDNKGCAKGFAEYKWSVPKAGKYYLWLYTACKNINDNSLWVSGPLGLGDGNSVQKTFASCPLWRGKLPHNLPHKHKTKGRGKKDVLCCPSYLAKNKKKGLDSFYTKCCVGGLGPDGDGRGCVLDLEVSKSARLWNMLPRYYEFEQPGVLKVRIFGREDGTSLSQLYLGDDPQLSSVDFT